jgi:hypothetical protein
MNGFRVAIESHGVIQAQCFVHIRQMWIRGAVLDVGWVAQITTHPEYRLQGLATEALNAALDEMRRRKVDITLLDALVTGFYERFGYSYCDGTQTAVFEARDLMSLPSSLSMERASPAEYPDLCQLHQEMTHSWSGSILREASSWAPECAKYIPDSPDVHVWHDRGGMLLAYSVTSAFEEETLCVEAHSRSFPGYREILHSLGADARHKGLSRVEIMGPLRRGILVAAEELGLTWTTESYKRETMGRVLNWESVFEKMRPFLDQRLPLAVEGTGAAIASVSCGGSRGRLEVDGRRLRWVTASNTAHDPSLIQLLFGVGASGQHPVSPEQRRLILLFPPENTHIWAADRL